VGDSAVGGTVLIKAGAANEREFRRIIECVMTPDEWEYDCLVRVKTSITLPEELLVSIDRVDSNRSSFIEKASRAYLVRLEKAKRDAADAEIINRNADRLNDEAMDVLEYQGLP
jgi:hypothetical protein